MNNNILAIISNKDTDEENLLMAIQQLSDVNETPDFWNAIANNTEYKKPHRAYCIFQLFQRHISIGMNLYEVGQLLGNSNWLKDEDIEIVHEISGEIPVTWTLEDTVFVLRIFPELPDEYNFAIYLRVSGKVERDSFIKLLRGKQVNQRVKNAVILEIGFTGTSFALSSTKKKI